MNSSIKLQWLTKSTRFHTVVPWGKLFYLFPLLAQPAPNMENSFLHVLQAQQVFVALNWIREIPLLQSMELKTHEAKKFCYPCPTPINPQVSAFPGAGDENLPNLSPASSSCSSLLLFIPQSLLFLPVPLFLRDSKQEIYICREQNQPGNKMPIY